MQDVPAIEQRGWAFPPVFESHNHRIQMQTGLENLAKCLKVMLATAPSERIGHPDYGCDLSGFAFQKISIELLELIEEIVDQSIESHESRIGIHDIQVAPDPNNDGAVIVVVQYSTPTGELAVNQILINLNTGQLISF